jgi:hypothetical protein
LLGIFAKKVIRLKCDSKREMTMRRWPNVVIFVCFFAFGAVGFFERGFAQSLEAQGKALELITGTADKICNIVYLAGNSQSVKVTGDVKAELSGLVRQVVNLGLKGAGELNSDQYEGIIRADLATAVQNNAQCKLKVFLSLKDTMVK